MSESAFKLSPQADHVYANYEPQITYIDDIWNIGYSSYEISVKDVSWEYMPMTDGWSDYIYSPVYFGQAFWFNEYSRPLGEVPEYDILTYNPRTDEPPNPLEVPFFTDEQGVWKLWDNKRKPLTEGLHYGMKRDPIGNLYYPGFPIFQPGFVSDFDIKSFDPERDPEPKWQETGYMVYRSEVLKLYMMLGAEERNVVWIPSKFFRRRDYFYLRGETSQDSILRPPGNVVHLNEYYVCLHKLIRGEDYAIEAV